MFGCHMVQINSQSQLAIIKQRSRKEAILSNIYLKFSFTKMVQLVIPPDEYAVLSICAICRPIYFHSSKYRQ